MEPGKPTLGIYGIPDRNNLPFPEESHDHGIVLMDQGKILRFLQLERKTRNKHDPGLGEYLYEYLKNEGLLTGDYDIAFSNNVLGSSMISRNGKLRLEGLITPGLTAEPVLSHAYWLNQRREAWLVNHELSHLFSAMPFYGGFPENSLLIHFDGGASLSNFSAWIYHGKEIKKLEAHWDLKYLSAFFNANALSFGIIGAKKEDQLAAPGKLMGLAAYGSYSPEIEDWLRRNKWFSDIWGNKKSFFTEVKKNFGVEISQLDTRPSFLQDILATMHTIFVRDTFKKINTLATTNKLDNLVFTGGSALNIVLNAKLVRSGLFREVLIPPCTNDSGLALGAAACLEWQKHGRLLRHSPYLENWNGGKEGETQHTTVYTDGDVEEAASWIDQCETIGVCNGYGEAGPRALGNRSLLCRTDKPELARQLSMDFKGREWYRPLAPIMRKEKLEKYTGEKNPSQLGKFMLDEFRILPSELSSISGAVHVDGTARIQFLESREDNPFIWDLLVQLENQYNIDCLINTSFNIRGEPIVDTIPDAMKSARLMGLKRLIIEGKPIAL